MNEVLESFKNIVDSSDGGDVGTPFARSIWLFGIEPGDSKQDQEIRESGMVEISDSDYSVDTQMRWVYNKNAFKLLASIDGKAVAEWESFAHEKQPFARGSKGYFKGNLYPVASQSLATWSERSQEELGIGKEDFYDWCRKERYPEIQKLVTEHQPALIIGVGVGHRNEFAKAFFGKSASEFLVFQSMANQRIRRLYYQETNGIKLVVVPHLSPRGPYCLSSTDAIQCAGSFIADWQTDQT